MSIEETGETRVCTHCLNFESFPVHANQKTNFNYRKKALG